MTRITVVQIAITSSSDLNGTTDTYAEYLDDKGRVWFQEGKFVYPPGKTELSDRIWVTKWKQLNLPEEPES